MNFTPRLQVRWDPLCLKRSHLWLRQTPISKRLVPNFQIMIQTAFFLVFLLFHNVLSGNMLFGVHWVLHSTYAFWNWGSYYPYFFGKFWSKHDWIPWWKTWMREKGAKFQHPWCQNLILCPVLNSGFLKIRKIQT